MYFLYGVYDVIVGLLLDGLRSACNGLGWVGRGAGLSVGWLLSQLPDQAQQATLASWNLTQAVTWEWLFMMLNSLVGVGKGKGSGVVGGGQIGA